MKTTKLQTITQSLPGNIADLLTPVSIYLKLRDRFPNSLLLESSDYHGSKNSMSYICFSPMATFEANNYQITYTTPGGEKSEKTITGPSILPQMLNAFIQSFEITYQGEVPSVNGLFGYSAYDSVKYYETIRLNAPKKQEQAIPDLKYMVYRYILAFNHFQNRLQLIENLPEGETSTAVDISNLLLNTTTGRFKFSTTGEEQSNITDEVYKSMVQKGKEHCYRGDVFQIVLSRQFAQSFKGDDFNVYRALRSINPSPYLFYFDFGSFRIFGSSPEAQLKVEEGKATINPIAGTFKRTGNDEEDRILAQKLTEDPKENAEHVMLVDLARNDLSRASSNVSVGTFREVQFYSHVIHLVSEVCGQLDQGTNTVQVFGDTFPAGTLSGAPKYKAMELIDRYENQSRGFYGGAIGYLGFDGELNHAITIRSFLSKNNTLFYQAGAGIVADSNEESELQEVNNKLGALKKALDFAKTFNS